MARPKEFNEQKALDAAVEVFREHGFAGASAGMLVDAMQIGRQSLYDTYGDKWKLYLAALQQYGSSETRAHIATMDGEAAAFAGIAGMLDRVVREAHRGCLGIGSVCEFGDRKPEIRDIHQASDHVLRVALTRRVREAQHAGEIAQDLDPDTVVDFLIATITGIRVAARGGADQAHLEALTQLALRALR